MLKCYLLCSQFFVVLGMLFANNKKAESFSLNLHCKMYMPGEYI